jgi:hypothetical protein
LLFVLSLAGKDPPAAVGLVLAEMEYQSSIVTVRAKLEILVIVRRKSLDLTALEE